MEARLPEIRKEEVLRYLGHRDQEIDSALESQLERCIGAVLSTARPRLTYRILPVTDSEIDGLKMGGNDIKSLLSFCNQAIIMAATLGPEAETLLRRTEVSDMADALIMDSAQSAAIEGVCDDFESQMRLSLRKEGLYLTDRFSPGYGDLPLEDQKKIMDALDVTKRIGLSVTPSGMMVPRKSVTCIIGISDKAQKLERSGCASCTLAGQCSFREQGRVCNGQDNT